MHNLSGIYVSPGVKVKYKNEELYSFLFQFPNPNQTKQFLCKSSEEYENWLSKLRSVLGYEDLNETYEIKETLGEGRFGLVKLCVQKKTKREAAIKIISKKLMNQEERQQVNTEIEILKISQHPNIVKLYDIFENQEDIYISNLYPLIIK